jgi:hypothetical protein
MELSLRDASARLFLHPLVLVPLLFTRENAPRRPFPRARRRPARSRSRAAGPGGDSDIVAVEVAEVGPGALEAIPVRSMSCRRVGRRHLPVGRQGLIRPPAASLIVGLWRKTSRPRRSAGSGGRLHPLAAAARRTASDGTRGADAAEGNTGGIIRPRNPLCPAAACRSGRSAIALTLGVLVGVGSAQTIRPAPDHAGEGESPFRQLILRGVTVSTHRRLGAGGTTIGARSGGAWSGINRPSAPTRVRRRHPTTHRPTSRPYPRPHRRRAQRRTRVHLQAVMHGVTTVHDGLGTGWTRAGGPQRPQQITRPDRRYAAGHRRGWAQGPTTPKGARSHLGRGAGPTDWLFAVEARALIARRAGAGTTAHLPDRAGG